jgi:RNase H-fold protein (predicted Holliday junction resolvase)
VRAFSSPNPHPLKILGIDLGEARVGLALSDDLGMLAHPLETWRKRK